MNCIMYSLWSLERSKLTEKKRETPNPHSTDLLSKEIALR